MNEKPAPDPRASSDLGQPRSSVGPWRKPWLWVFLLLLAVGMIGWWIHGLFSSGASGLTGSSGLPVSVERVRRQNVRVTINAIGSITAFNTAVVRAQVSGMLQKLMFREGQQVQAGQALAQIDPRAFEDSQAQAEGALARDQAQLQSARVDLTRYQDLFAKDAVAKQQVDTQAALVGQLEGTVKADNAGASSAKLQLSYATVTAPIAGRVGLKQADLGNVVAPNDPTGIVTITQTRPIALVFAVPAANLPQIAGQLRSGTAVPVEAWDSSGKKRLATGKVLTLDNAIDTGTDTIKAKAIFSNEDETLFPNQAVSVRLQLDLLPNVLSVPQAAVLNGSRGAYVYVVNDDGLVHAQPVTPGAVDNDWIAIEGPLQAGQKVVVDGVDRLREGAKVEVIDPGSTAKSGAGDPASN